MRFSRRVEGLRACLMVLACGLVLPSLANTSPAGQRGETIRVRFDPVLNETRVTAQVSPRLCVSLALAREWRLTHGNDRTALVSAAEDAEFVVSVRSARDLQHLPHPDLPSRDAALLQSDYESLLGRPAQAVSLDAVGAGVTRWTATWIDGHLPTASRALTVETFIVPLSDDWVLELSLDKVDARDAYQALARQALASLRIREECAGVL